MMSTIGAIIGLLLSIFLIIKRIPIAYSLMIGAITGGLSGGLSLVDSVSVMVDGVKDITPAILRILAAGVLFGNWGKNMYIWLLHCQLCYYALLVCLLM